MEKLRADSNHYCSNCNVRGGGEKRLLLCKACRTIWYCGAECQKADWKMHKRVCQQQVAATKLGSEGLLRVEHAMQKWIGKAKPGLQNAGLYALLPTRGGLAKSLLETNTLVVEIKETPDGSGQFAFVSATVKPMEFLKRCLVPPIYDDLIEEVRGEVERKKLSLRLGQPVIGQMVTCVMCWCGEECVRQVTPTAITADIVKQVANWPVDKNWEKTLKDTTQGYKWFRAPDKKVYPIPVDLAAELGKKEAKKKTTA